MPVVVAIVLLDLTNWEFTSLEKLRHWDHWRLSLTPFSSLPATKIDQAGVVLEACSHDRPCRNSYGTCLLFFIFLLLLFRRGLVVFDFFLLAARFIGFFCLWLYFLCIFRFFKRVLILFGFFLFILIFLLFGFLSWNGLLLDIILRDGVFIREGFFDVGLLDGFNHISE